MLSGLPTAIKDEFQGQFTKTKKAKRAFNKEVLDLIYLMRKAFLKRAMVELVYKFAEKSTACVLKGNLTTKVSFKLFLGSHTYIHIIIILEKWFPLQGERAQLFCMYDERFEISKTKEETEPQT